MQYTMTLTMTLRMNLERDKRETKLWIEKERSNYGNREREIKLWK